MSYNNMNFFGSNNYKPSTDFYPQAEKYLRLAVRACAPGDPDADEYAFRRCLVLTNYAGSLTAQGQLRKARQLHEESIGEFRRRRNKENLYSPFRHFYYMAVHNLAEMQLLSGEYDEVRKTLQDGIMEAEDEWKGVPDNLNYGEWLLNMYQDLGDAQANLGHFEEACRAAQAAESVAEKVARKAGTAPIAYTITCRVAAKALRGLHKPREALDMLAKALQARGRPADGTGSNVYQLAACQALASALVKENPSLVPESERQTRASVLADQSLASLKKAMVNAWQRTIAERDPDLEAIRSRPEFKELMATMPEDPDKQDRRARSALIASKSAEATSGPALQVAPILLLPEYPHVVHSQR
jgi:tetratricopeptide (TPR) repeat protein